MIHEDHDQSHGMSKLYANGTLSHGKDRKANSMTGLMNEEVQE